ncbi:BRLZ domain containing protein [Pyrenophora tritici-repentis]|nr:BRLZ domain containing protein [Pyrenophora tritici-repentis]
MPKKRSSSAANITNEDEKSQRKRVQNRISQRCSREKKLTQNRNIANFIELVKKAQTGSHENNKVLVNAYAELMQENDQLNEALLRMRKKLLSISNSSEAAANDPIFEKLLEPKGNQRHDLGLSNYAGHDSLLEGDDIERENRVGDPFGAFSREIDYDFLDHFVMPTPCDFPDGPARNVSFFRTLSPSPPTFAAPNSLIGSFGRLSYVRMMDALEKACMIYLCEELDVQHDSTKLHEPATLLDLKLRCMNIASSKMVHDLAAVA